MGFELETGLSALTVFLQGLLSFFSPCVLPLVPLYVSYLAGGTGTVGEDGVRRYPRKKVLVNTLFFVLGVSFAFFLLGLGFTALGRFFSGNRAMFARVSGVLMVFFGLYQLGIFGKEGALERERRLPFRLDRWVMGPPAALLLGFTFSFAWTPCVGPALTGVLLMASSASSAAAGFLLIGVYTLGFVLPFLAVGLFTGSVLELFRRRQAVVKYTVKVGAVLLILMGVMTLTGYMNTVTSYLSSLDSAAAPAVTASPSAEPGPDVTPAPTQTPSPTQTPTPTQAPSPSPEQTPAPEQETAEDPEAFPAPDFVLTDQNGETHSLADYEGKVIFLNFWATWCGPCKNEMPHIQALYEEYGENGGEDVVFLGVANPRTETAPYNSDVTREEVEAFLSQEGYTFPTVMDETGEVFRTYGISAFPTTFMIDREGNLFGYVQGQLTESMMRSIIEQTLTGERAS